MWSSWHSRDLTEQTKSCLWSNFALSLIWKLEPSFVSTYPVSRSKEHAPTSNTMLKLLVILFVIKLYVRINIFRNVILFSIFVIYFLILWLSLTASRFFDNIYKIILNTWQKHDPSGNLNLPFHFGMIFSSCYFCMTLLFFLCIVYAGIW